MTATPRSGKRLAAIFSLSSVLPCLLGAIIVPIVLWLSGDMRAVTHDFLGQARRGEFAGAYRMASGQLRGSVSEAAFPAYVQSQLPSLRGSSGEWINGFSGGDDRYCVEAWMTQEGSLGWDTAYILLQKEDGVWRIDSVTEHEPDECDSGD